MGILANVGTDEMFEEALRNPVWATAQQKLVAFEEEVAARVAALDPDTLVTVVDVHS